MCASLAIPRFCGIDIGKSQHVGCVIDAAGQLLVKPFSFFNDRAGYQRLLSKLGDAGGPTAVSVGLEATGHYWYGVHEFLTRQGYPVVVFNPLQTAQQAKKGIRKTQTDRIDARHIATLLKNGDYHATLIPGDLAMACRQLTRLRHAIIRQTTRLKLLLWSRLQPVWPEYETLFSEPFGPTGRALLAAAPTPADALALDSEELAHLIRKASRGRLGADRARRVREVAVESVGMRRGQEAARIGIRTVLQAIDVLRPIRTQLEAQILQVGEQVPGYVKTLPGCDALAAVSLFAETDPISAFKTPDQLVAFAGLDVVVWASGQMLMRRSISKRGSPHLRYTLWSMARQACLHDAELMQFYQRKRKAGLHHLSAVTATSIKLCRIAWRIMTDQRPYQPARPAAKP